MPDRRPKPRLPSKAVRSTTVVLGSIAEPIGSYEDVGEGSGDEENRVGISYCPLGRPGFPPLITTDLLIAADFDLFHPSEGSSWHSNARRKTPSKLSTISVGSSHTKPAGFPNRRKEQLPGGGVEMVNGLAVHKKVSAANWAPSGTPCSGRNTTESSAAATGRARQVGRKPPTTSPPLGGGLH